MVLHQYMQQIHKFCRWGLNLFMAWAREPQAVPVCAKWLGVCSCDK